jgi:hypothetical protein
MPLRLQKERMRQHLLTSLDAYHRRFGLSHQRLGREPGAVSGMQRGALEGKGRQVHEMTSAIRVPRSKAA